MGPIVVDFDMQNLRYATKSCDVAIPAIELTLVQVSRASRGMKEEV